MEKWVSEEPELKDLKKMKKNINKNMKSIDIFQIKIY